MTAGDDQKSAWKEVELKLVGAPTTLRTLFRELEGTAPPSAKIVSTYYDTPEDRLSDKGYSLRLRQRDGEFELTLKRSGSSALTRSEWTAQVPDATVDIDLLPRAAPRRKIGALASGRLAARYASETRRARKVLKADDALIEVVLDVGTIRADGHELSIAEIEFELIDGPAVEMLHFVRALLGRRRLSVSTLSKSERGRALIEGSKLSATRTGKPTFTAQDTVADAFRKIAGATARHMLANVPVAQEGSDPEGLHQLRVALRRWRSVLPLFEDHLGDLAAGVREQARLALKRLGAARDIDVFLLETLPPLLGEQGDDATLRQLAERAQEHRRAAHTEVGRLIVDPGFNRLLLDLLIHAEDANRASPVGDHPIDTRARALLKRRHKQVLESGRDFAELSYPERHRVRLAVKKLRYACDHFKSLFPKPVRRDYLKRLARLQGDLGSLNDASLAEHIANRVSEGDDLAGLGAAQVKGWYRHRLHEAEPRMREAWHGFAGARPFWKG